MTKEVRIGDIRISNENPLVLIAGPCVIESEESCLSLAEKLKRITEELEIPLIFKSSYDKGNRSAIDSYRGPGLKEGLRILKKVKRELNLPLLSDIHHRGEVTAIYDVIDIIQIPAFLSRQTDLLVEAAQTGKAINVKKGQFLAPWEMKNVVNKIANTGNENILLTERGFSFGYNNLVVDMRSLPIMGKLGYPLVFDATHSVQLPGGAGTSSSGQREYVPHLSRAAVAIGIAALFLEVHESPDKALCDGPNMLKLEDLRELLIEVQAIDRLVKLTLRGKKAYD